MTKGINHQVIEITQTDNKYFDRALLVVNPEYASAHRELLEKEARKMIREMSVPTAVSKKLSKSKVGLFILSSVLGSFVTAIIYTVF